MPLRPHNHVLWIPFKPRAFSCQNSTGEATHSCIASGHVCTHARTQPTSSSPARPHDQVLPHRNTRPPPHTAPPAAATAPHLLPATAATTARRRHRRECRYGVLRRQVPPRRHADPPPANPLPPPRPGVEARHQRQPLHQRRPGVPHLADLRSGKGEGPGGGVHLPPCS